MKALTSQFKKINLKGKTIHPFKVRLQQIKQLTISIKTSCVPNPGKGKWNFIIKELGLI